jgi:putative flippase GtrA
MLIGTCGCCHLPQPPLQLGRSRMPSKLPARIYRSDLFRYFGASLLALAVDVATFSGCLRVLGLSVSWSASLGFVAGAAVAYFASIRWVFRDRAFGNAPALEFLTFVAIGVAGLGITQFVLWMGVTELGLVPELVKLGAAGVTFTFNYVMRKSLLFATSRRMDTRKGKTV